MNLKKILREYGSEVPGYAVRVVNEREVRAAAGILGILGMIVAFVALGFNHIIVARVYLAFMFIDFTARLVSTNYAPSLLMGKFFVQNQKPEYVGAAQKRFAWFLGWIIFLPMLWWFVINWDISFYKALLCVLCLLLTFLESAFSICIGCMLYKYISKDELQYCPGGVCEIREKEPIQMFNPIQKAIAGLTMLGLVVGTYLFLATQEPKTFFGEFLHEAVLTDAQLQKEKDAAFQKTLENEFKDDEDF